MAPSHLWPGVPLALGSAVLFGATAPLSKLLLGKVDAQLLAGLLYLGAGGGLFVVHLARQVFGVPAPEAPLRRSDMPWLAAIILFGGVLAPLLLMLGLNLTDAATGSLLLNLESLATMGIAWIVFRENVDARLILGAFAILLGAMVLSWEGQGLSVDAGAALIAAACLAWGIDNNLTRKLSSADPVLIAMANRDWGALAAVLPLGTLFGAVHALTPGHGKMVLASYLLGSGLAAARALLVAILMAATHISSAIVLALLGAPLITRAFVGVGRAPSLELISRGILVVIGLWLVLRAFRRRPHVHGEGPAVSLAAGLVPCPLTLFVMIYALARGVPEAGLTFAAAMWLGVALTLSLVALVVVFARERLLALSTSSGASMDRVSRVLDGLAGLALVLIAARELLR